MLYPITLDGFAAAYAAWLRLGPDATYFGYYEPADVDLRVVDGATVRASTDECDTSFISSDVCEEFLGLCWLANPGNPGDS